MGGAGQKQAVPDEQKDIEQKQLLEPTTNKMGWPKPEQWQPTPKLEGAGQCECQGFDTWTDEEKKEWEQGLLRCKWAVGQVSIRKPVRTATQLIALVYGYLPFIIPIWFAVWSIISAITNGKPRFFPFYGLCIAAGFALINETITKKLCRKFMDPAITSRPPEAVCKHPGMPSGHVLNAYTLMTWCLLEALFDTQIYPEWLLIVVIVMAPVPWARVYNKDHTVLQTQVSGCLAVILGIVAYLIRRTYFGGHESPWTMYHLSEGYESSIPNHE